MLISGSKVLLTGASGGLGHDMARALHRAGAELVLTGRRAEALAPLAAETGATELQADLSDRGQVAKLIADHSDADILIANAALPASGRIESFSVAEIDTAIEVNIRSTIVLAHGLGIAMAKRGHGHIVLISSLAGKSGQAGSSIYSATKFALRGFAQGLRADLRSTGVGVSCILPGFIRDAGMYADSGARLPRGVGTSAPSEVSDAVIKAITQNKGEIVVAPAAMRLGAVFAGIAPEVAAAVSRRSGAEHVSGEFAAGQQDKRS